MSEKASKKINVGPLPDQVEDYSHFEETELRWDRILIALVLLVLVIWGIYALLFSSESDPQQRADQETATIETVKATEVEQIIQEPLELEKTGVEKSGDNQSAKELVQADELKAESPEATALLAEPEAKSVESEHVQAKPILTEQVTDKEQTKAAVEVSTKVSEPIVKPEPQKAEEIKTSLDPIQIKHPGIANARLTSMLKNGEPVDQLGSMVSMNQDGIIKVVLYTEMLNIKGTKLRHIWYRNGIKQATVKVPANYNSQRSSSSKFINAQMLGEWRVDVIDENQILFAQAKFLVIPFEA